MGQKRIQHNIIVPDKEIETFFPIEEMVKDFCIKEIEKFFPIGEIETNVCVGETETLAETVQIKTYVPEETSHDFVFQEHWLKQQGNLKPYYDHECVAEELIANNQEIESVENDFIEDEVDIESEIKTIDIPSPSNDVFEKQIDNELEFKKVGAANAFDNNLGVYSEVVGGEFELKTIGESGLSNIIKENEIHYIDEEGVRLKVKEEMPIVEEEETSTISDTVIAIIGSVLVGVLILLEYDHQRVREFAIQRKKFLQEQMKKDNIKSPFDDEEQLAKSNKTDEQDNPKSAFDDDEEFDLDGSDKFDFDSEESEFIDDNNKFIWSSNRSKKRFWSEGSNLGGSEKISIGANNSSGLMFATDAPVNIDSTPQTIYAPFPNLTRRQILRVRGQQELVQVNRNILRRLQLRIVRMPMILRPVRVIENIRTDIEGIVIDPSNLTIARLLGNSIGIFKFIINYNPFETESPLPFTTIYFCFVLYGFVELQEIFNFFFNHAQIIVDETNSLRYISFYGQDARNILKIIKNIFELTRIISKGEKKFYLSYLKRLIKILNDYLPVHTKGEH